MSDRQDDFLTKRPSFSPPSPSAVSLPTQRREQERLLRVCNTPLHNLLNLEVLFPHLVQEGLLTRHEKERLKRLSPTLPDDASKIDHLLKIIPGKGKNALKRFVKCLQRTEDGTAHDELVRLMTEAYAQGYDNYVSIKKDDIVETKKEYCTNRSFIFITMYTIAVVIVLGFGMHYFGITQGVRYQFNMLQSSSLPYPPKTFVGKEQELNELVEFISKSFSNDEHRVMNIIGPPGIGKTTLAIHIGHKMVATGVVVHHINVAEFPDELVQQVLAEKVLKSAEIITNKAGDFERLLRWARECYWYNLLILDNCDDALNYQKEKFQTAIQKIVETSPKVKVLMTSREISITLNYMKQHKTSELSMESACDLLAKKVPIKVNLTAEKREKIAELTGKIPLALQIIASLFSMSIPPSSEEIIYELENEPIKTLSHDAVPEDSKVNVSFNLSYKYLRNNLKIIASYVAHFPGSFTKEAAIFSVVDLVHGGTHEERAADITRALRSLIERSLLEYDMRKNRYYYHRLIREFFRIKNVNHGNKLESFLSGFNRFFSNKLYEFAWAFHTHHKPSLSFLDTERHNIQLLLESLAGQKITQKDDFISAITALAISLDLDFLTCRFTSEELLGPVRGSLTYLDQHIKQYMTQVDPGPMKLDCNYELKISVTFHRLICTYESLIHHLSEIENQLHGHEVAATVYGDRKDIMEDIIPYMKSRHVYIDFLKRLAHYYHLLGLKDAEIDTHRHIIFHSQALTNECKSDKCRYDDIAKLYVSLGEHEEAARFYELSLSTELHNGVILKVEIMYELLKVYEQLRLYDKVSDLLEKLISISMQEEIISSPASQIFRYNDVVRNIIKLYRQHGYHEYAYKLEEKLFESLSAIGAKQDEDTLKTGVKLVRNTFHDRNYQKTLELGGKIVKMNITDTEKREVQILIGRAKFHSGYLSAGLDDLETVFGDTGTDKETRAKLCWYLMFRPTKHFGYCSPIKLRLYTVYELARTFWLILFKTVPQLKFTNRVSLPFEAFTRPARQFGTLSHQRDLSTTGKEVNIWNEISTHFHFIDSIKQLLHLIQYYAVHTTLFCINSNSLWVLFNVASVLFRLWMFFKFFKFSLKFISFAVEHWCFTLTILSPFVIILVVLVVVFVVLPFYLHHLKVLSI